MLRWACILLLLGLGVAAQAQYNSFPPGVFSNRAALDPAPIAASIAFVGAADGGNNGGSTNSLTFSYTTGSGSGRLLAVCLLGDTTTDDVTGVTYNGVSMTLAAKIAPSNSTRWNYLFYLLNPASGANNVVVSATSTHVLIAGAGDYSGVAALDATNTNGTAIVTNTLTSSITTVANNSWALLCSSGFASNSAPTAGTGATRRTFDAVFGGWGLFDSNLAITPAGSYSMTTDYPFSTSGFTHVLASFHP